MSILPKGIVTGLAEIVLRVKDIDAMQAFYTEVLGLTFWRRFGDDMVFFKVADISGARPQTVALFVDRWPSNIPGAHWSGLDSSATTLHHFALQVALPDLTKAGELLDSAEISTVKRTFPWVGWRSLMLRDPEGNVIELVAVDQSVYDQLSN